MRSVGTAHSGSKPRKRMLPAAIIAKSRRRMRSPATVSRTMIAMAISPGTAPRMPETMPRKGLAMAPSAAEPASRVHGRASRTSPSQM